MSDTVSTRRSRIALIDDHAVLGVGVATMLAPVTDLRFLGTYPTLQAMVVDLGHEGAPDVVLLDDRSDPAANVTALQALNCAVVVYTSGDDVYLMRRACEAGVLGIVRKSEDPQVLIDTIRAAAHGELTPSLEWASILDSDTAFVLGSLSELERQILALYASGAQADYVARRVGRSVNTVNKRINAIRQRFMDVGLPAASRVDLLRRAQDAGLIPTILPIDQQQP